jgi:hypothetical protein
MFYSPKIFLYKEVSTMLRWFREIILKHEIDEDFGNSNEKV